MEQIVEAANGVHRYFSVAPPLHERDEEDSLAPRLLESSRAPKSRMPSRA